MKILKIIGECVSTLIIFIIIAVFAFGCAAGIILLERSNTAENTLAQIQSKYTYDAKANIYYDDAEVLDNAHQVLSNAYNILPNHIVRMIKSNWTIVVADSQPFDSTNNVVAAGITYSSKNVIWVVSDFDEAIFVHEVGHALDTYLGTLSDRPTFKSLYDCYWEAYREYDKNKINKHSVSSTNEFFASTFADYILHPEYVKEVAPDVYTFFESITALDSRFSNIGHFLSLWFDVGYHVVDVFINIFVPDRPYANANTVISEVNNSIAENSLLNLDDYEAYYDISWMSDDTRQVAQTLIDLSKDPESYPCEKHGFSYGYLIEFDYPWSIDMYTEILSFTSAYFGDESLDPVDVNVVNGVRTDVVIKHDVVALGEQNRVQSLEKVEKVLKTLKNGTKTEIAVQVADYICKNSDYKLEKHSSFNSFWINQKGDCVMYALIFKQFMDRLGIENDLIHIVSDQGEGHVYNRIFDGEHYRYYDLTYDVLDVDIMDKSGYHLNTWQVQ